MKLQHVIEQQGYKLHWALLNLLIEAANSVKSI